MSGSSLPGSPDVLRVFEGVEFQGRCNVTEDVVLEQVRSAIRRGHSQVFAVDGKHPNPVVILGGGPSLSLTETQAEIRSVLWPSEGDRYLDEPKVKPILVTVNGSYHWAIEHNFKPDTQIVMDARPHNARFVDPPVPDCRYLLASQCHQDVWDRVEWRDRDDVWIFHAASGEEHDPLIDVLDEYYMGQYLPVGGGTTVITRALILLARLGYFRFHLFGVDSCWMGKTHHAYDQPENERDRRLPFKVSPTGHPELERTFWCAPWHAKQAEDFLQLIRLNGDHFMVDVHGDGLLAYLLKVGADAALIEQAHAEDV